MSSYQPSWARPASPGATREYSLDFGPSFGQAARRPAVQLSPVPMAVPGRHWNYGEPHAHASRTQPTLYRPPVVEGRDYRSQHPFYASANVQPGAQFEGHSVEGPVILNSRVSPPFRNPAAAVDVSQLQFEIQRDAGVSSGFGVSRRPMSPISPVPQPDVESQPVVQPQPQHLAPVSFSPLPVPNLTFPSSFSGSRPSSSSPRRGRRLWHAK